MGIGLKTLLIGFATVFGLLLLRRFLKKGGVRAFFLSAVQGAAAVFAVNLLGAVFPMGLAVNWWSLGTSVVVGLPGVVGMLVLDTVLRT